jgi:hypothetical protein
MSDKITWHKYVRIEDIPAYLALGWEWYDRATPLHSPHGNYSVLMTWPRSSEPVEPIKSDNEPAFASGIACE